MPVVAKTQSWHRHGIPVGTASKSQHTRHKEHSKFFRKVVFANCALSHSACKVFDYYTAVFQLQLAQSGCF
jgi:hypothetical protein